MTKVTVATGNNTGLPNGTDLEVFAAADGGLGGYAAVVDPANPTHALKPDVNGAIPVTATALPLPTGAATETTLAAVGTKLDNLHTDLGSQHADEVQLHTDIATLLHGDIGATNTKLDTLHTDNGVVLTGFAQQTGGTGFFGIFSWIATVLGWTTGAAIVTDVNGTIQQYLRGLVKLFASITFKAASTAAVDADPALVVRSSAAGDRGDAAYADVTGAASGSFIGLLKGLYVRLASSLGVYGTIVNSSQNSTHVNAATTYASGQVWADNATAGSVTMQSLSGLVRGANSWAYLVRLRVAINRAIALPAIRVHFWRGTPSVKTGDNLAFAYADADVALYMGYVDLPASVLPGGAGTTGSTAFDGTIRYAVQGDASGIVYYTLELRGAFVSQGTDVLRVHATADQAA